MKTRFVLSLLFCIATSLFSISAQAVVKPQIVGGSGLTLALKSDGTVWQWGMWQPLVSISDGMSITPVQAPGLTDIVQIAAGNLLSVALKADGTVWHWGAIHGNPPRIITTPQQVSGLSDVLQITTIKTSVYALKSDGTVWAWGNNGNRNLVDGTNIDRTTPAISGLTGVVKVSGGSSASNTFALKNDGSVWTWGSNTNGQYGDGTTTYSYAPIQISALAGFSQIVAGGSHGLGLKSDGTVWAWGDNTSGQLGDGTTTAHYTPLQVPNLKDIIQIEGGSLGSLALKSDGTVWAWGNNSTGQLGDATTTNRSTPSQIPNLTNVHQISSGGNANFALKTDGSVWAVGLNLKGSLGDGTTIERHSLVQSQINLGTYPLNISKTGSGTGTVISSLFGINCDNDCSENYLAMLNVTLTATADAGSAFTGWSGDCSGTTSSVSLTMNQAKNCTATFKKLYLYTLTKLGTGSGTPMGSISNGGALSFTCTGNVCTTKVIEGSWVALNIMFYPAGDTGSVFGGWGGDCLGLDVNNEGVCHLEMNAPKNVTVTFNKNELTIQKSGDGSGVVSSPTLNCGATCSAVFAAGTSVSLTPTPNVDSYFGGWNDPSCNTAITMNAPKTCIATFLKKPVLTVTKIGNGIIKGIGIDCGADCSESYSSKTATVALTATADAGYVFSNWSGNCSGNSNSCTLTMDSDKTATANFTACTYTLSNSSANVTAKATNGSFVASSNCALETAKSDASWLTLSQTNGTINYTVSTNLSTSERTGNITLNGQTFKVVQAANQKPIANFTMNSSSGLPMTVKVDASFSTDPEDSPLEYQWTVPYNNQNAVGKIAQFVFDKEGSYTITLTIKDNTGQTHSQTQSPPPPECPPYGLNSTVSPLLKAAGDTNSFVITSNKGNCPLSASTDQSWVIINSPLKTDANGNATISYTVASNPNTVDRTAKITVNNQAFTVNQAKLDCTYTLSATVANHGNNAESGSVSVTPASCNLTAKSNVDWITISSQSNGVVNYSVVANTATQNRTGTLTVAGQTFTINQASSSCEYTLSANSMSYSGIANSGSFNVNTNLATCAWQATPNVDWITLSKNNGTGTSAIDYKVAANPCTTPREATIVIGNKTFAITQAGGNPLPPIATFSATPTLGTTQADITLNAADSQAQSCGSIVSYDWLITKENSQTTFSAQGKNTQLTLEEEGLYWVTLTIKDSNGQTTVSEPKSIVIEKHLSFNAYRCATSDFNGFKGCQINTEKKLYYQIGNKLKVTLDSKIATNRFERLDLWVAIQLPNGEFLFMTSQPVNRFRFYHPPQYNGEAFMPNVEFASREDTVLEFDVPKNMSGKYIFYALYVALGKNPLLDNSSWRSNLAIKEITLE